MTEMQFVDGKSVTVSLPPTATTRLPDHINLLETFRLLPN